MAGLKNVQLVPLVFKDSSTPRMPSALTPISSRKRVRHRLPVRRLQAPSPTHNEHPLASSLGRTDNRITYSLGFLNRIPTTPRARSTHDHIDILGSRNDGALIRSIQLDGRDIRRLLDLLRMTRSRYHMMPTRRRLSLNPRPDHPARANDQNVQALSLDATGAGACAEATPASVATPAMSTTRTTFSKKARRMIFDSTARNARGIGGAKVSPIALCFGNKGDTSCE